jgi:salicylate hydroxylase
VPIMIVAQAPEHRKSFTVAVVGGGITGLVFAVALCRRGVPVQVYEAAPLFEEIGAGVGLGPNAVRALQLLSQEMYEIFIRYAIGNESVDKQRTMFDMRHGIGKPSLITSLSAAGIGAQNIHRAHFLDALAGLLPDGIVRFGKRLRSVDEEQGGKMILRFEDGSTAGADAVIGCDGIKSRVRHLVLSPDSPARDPQFSGKYVYRGIIPMARAIELLGEDLAMNSQGFLGPHGHVLTFPIAHGKLMNVVAFSTARDGEWVNEKWVVPVPAERVQSDFRSWGPPVQAIVKVNFVVMHCLFFKY